MGSLEKSIYVPYVFEVDQSCEHIPRVDFPFRMPSFDDKECVLGTHPDLFIEWTNCGIFLRSRKIRAYCQVLVVFSIPIKLKDTESVSSPSVNGYALYGSQKSKPLIFIIQLHDKTIHLFDVYKSKVDVDNIPDILKLLYLRARNLCPISSGRGAINYYLDIMFKHLVVHPSIIYDENLTKKEADLYYKIFPSRFNGGHINSEFSEFFEDNPSLMSDDEYEDLNGSPR